jgi:hypothetical protein
MRKLILLTLVIVTGCGSVSTQKPPPNAIEPHDPEESLFASDAELLSDDDINRILKTRVHIPEAIRVGLIFLEHRSLPDYGRYWYYYRIEEPTEELRLAVKPVLRLRDDDRVYDVSYLPTFLLPEQLTVGVIREAGARYQADWVLLFKTETRSYSKWRPFRPDQARAYCVAECAVLDVRTGIIPFTSRAKQNITIEEEDKEWSATETVERSELVAIEAAMNENIDNLLRFLKQIPD